MVGRRFARTVFHRCGNGARTLSVTPHRRANNKYLATARDGNRPAYGFRYLFAWRRGRVARELNEHKNTNDSDDDTTTITISAPLSSPCCCVASRMVMTKSLRRLSYFLVWAFFRHTGALVCRRNVLVFVRFSGVHIYIYIYSLTGSFRAGVMIDVRPLYST